MPVVARGSGESASAVTSHVVTLPEGILADDAILVAFTQQHATEAGADASTSSSGWANLDEQWNGTSTNLRGTIFYCADSAADGSPLMITTTTAQTATWLVFVIRSATGDVFVVGSSGSSATAATVAANTGRTSADYVHIVALGVDSNTDGFVPHITSPPSGYTLTEVTPADNTADSVSTLAVDGELEGVTGASSPATLTYDGTGPAREQWVSFNVLIAHTPGEVRRFYLGNASPGIEPSGALGFWDDTDTGLTDRHRLSETPVGAADSVAETSPATAATWDVLLGQWVSAPASADGVITGAYGVAAAWLESSAAANLFPHVAVWVPGGIPINRFNSSRELPTTAAGVEYTDDDTVGPGSVAFTAGQRIVVELGYRSDNTNATPVTGTLNFGGTGSPDMADGVTTLSRPAWVDLTLSPPGIVFEESGVNGTAAASLGFAGTATGTVVPITRGTTSATLGGVATAAGRPRRPGTASAALGFTATVAGTVVPPVPGAASAALGFTAAAAGIVLQPGRGNATSALGFAATAVGRRNMAGAAASALGFAATARARRRTGTASAALELTAAADGAAIGNIAGAAAAALGFAASANGQLNDGITGTAAAALGFTAAAAGSVVESLGVPFLVHELGDDARACVEIAWGADLLADSSTWVWTDVTRDVRQDPGISTALGRANEASTTQPASCSMVLDNSDRAYSQGGRSPNWPWVRRNTPVRVRINPGTLGFQNVFFGFADGFTPGWDVTDGSVPIATLSASGTLRRLAQGSAPVMSAYRRAMIATESVIAYWPFEEGKNASRAPAIRGGSDMTSPVQHEFDSASDFDCSAPIVTMRSTDALQEAFSATVDPYVGTGENQVRWLMTVPRDGLPHGCFLMDVQTSGSAARWALTYSAESSSTAGAVNVTIWDDEGDVLSETFNIQVALNGLDQRCSIELVQDGADVTWQIGFLGETDEIGGFFTRTITDHTVGTVTGLSVGGNDSEGLAVGHVTVQNAQTSLFEATGPLRAYRGEYPSSSDPVQSRLYRLCAENSVKLTRHLPGGVGGPNAGLETYETMGPQLVAPLLDLLRECETCDQGILWDGLDDGLSFTTRRRREDGEVRLSIDAGAGELAAPFEPVDDDADTVNKAEAKILTGISGLHEDVAGPLGTASIGIYDTSITINNQNDDMAVQYAAWRVHLGTVGGYRFPSVTVDLRAAPDLAGAVLAVVPGDRIEVANLDAVFGAFDIEDAHLEVQGISHEVSPTSWRVTFQCSPFSPWGIAQVAEESGDTSEVVWRLDTDGSVIASDSPVGDTSLAVTSTGGPAWTTVADDYPMDLDVGGVRVRATACTTGVAVEGLNVVVMVGDPDSLTTGDAAIVDRLTTTLGHTVELVDDSAAEFGGDYDGVLIAESVVDTLATTKYAATAKPLIIMEPAIWDDHELSAATISTAAQTAWNVQAVDELDAGLSGATTVYSASQGQRHANISLLGSGAQVVAQLAGDATRATYFAYDTGAALVTGNAPARRVALGIPDAAVAALTDDGWALFDAAVAWAYGATDDTLQSFTVDALPVARPAGLPVKLWDPRPIGL